MPISAGTSGFQVKFMTLMALFFLVIVVIPLAWWVSRLFHETALILTTWIVAAVIIFGGVVAFIFHTFDDAAGGEAGWGQIYRDIGEGEH
jgi:hypothetical protein